MTWITIPSDAGVFVLWDPVEAKPIMRWDGVITIWDDGDTEWDDGDTIWGDDKTIWKE